MEGNTCKMRNKPDYNPICVESPSVIIIYPRGSPAVLAPSMPRRRRIRGWPGCNEATDISTLFCVFLLLITLCHRASSNSNMDRNRNINIVVSKNGKGPISGRRGGASFSSSSSIGGHKMDGMFFNKRINVGFPLFSKQANARSIKGSSSNLEVVKNNNNQGQRKEDYLFPNEPNSDEEPGVAEMQKEYEKDRKKFGVGFKQMNSILSRLKIRTNPEIYLKARKSFDFLQTVFVIGMDYNVHNKIAQFKSSWTDKIIGARLSVKGTELQLSKSWNIALGERDDISTKLRFRVAIDTRTGAAYYRCGFRAETVMPINLKKGVVIKKKIPVTRDNMVQIEYKANINLPEPNLEYSYNDNQVVVGLGDIKLSLDELNLILNL